MKAKRRISQKRMLVYYDQYGERLSVISYQRRTKEKVMSARHLNVFEALKEISLRNTIDTYALLALDLPEDLVEFKDVKPYRCTIDDFYFGQTPPTFKK
jgi:hypothetical protein